MGTAHVSKQSVDLVKQTIDQYEPESIFVELDENRKKNILDKKYLQIDVIQIIKKKQVFFYIAYFLLSFFQRNLSKKTGSKPGAEFKAAILLANKMQTNLFCCDRNVGVSLRRLWRSMTFWEKIKLFFLNDNHDIGGIKEIDNETIEKLKEPDQLNKMLLSLGKKLPIVKNILIDERDIYMSSNIYQNLAKTNVAVVGAGHVPGMLKQFSNLKGLSKKDIKSMKKFLLLEYLAKS